MRIYCHKDCNYFEQLEIIIYSYPHYDGKMGVLRMLLKEK